MTRQGGAGRRPRGSSLGSGRDPHCRARGLRLLQLRVQTAPQDSSLLPEAQQLGPWRVRRTSENQLVIESQQVEEPGWARPEQVAWGTPLDHRGAGDAGQKLHFRREGRGSKRKMEGD